MILKTELTIEDHNDFRRVRGLRLRDRARVVFLQLVILGLLGTSVSSGYYLADTLFQILRDGRLAEVVGNPSTLLSLGFGLLLVPVLLAWCYWAIRILRTLSPRAIPVDPATMRDGLDVGPIVFETLTDAFRETTALNDNWYLWTAFNDIRESEENLYLMFDGEDGVIVPKRAFSDARAAEEFRALVQREIRTVA